VKKTRRLRQSLLLILLAVGLISQSAAVEARAPWQTDATLQECSQVDETALQDELNTVTQQVFAQTLDDVDLAAIVDRRWAALGMDAVLDAEVDRAVARIRNEKALWDTFLSGWSADQAEELTRAVATYAFESEAFSVKLDKLATAVADVLAQQIALLSAESASAAYYCLQTFIADNYSGVLVRKFEEQVQNATQTVDMSNSSELDSSILTVLGQHRTALGGIGVIIAAQIAKRIVATIGQQIAKRVAGRIVGRILGRIGTEVIPVVGWIIGTGMIAYDLYTGRDGALPQIQEQLKSEEVKAGIRGEMVAAIEPEFRRETPQIARDVANELFRQWRDVRRNIRQVLELAETNPAFRSLLNRLQTSDDLVKLVATVGVAVPALGKEAFEQAVVDGSLEQVLRQPESALQIIASARSIDLALDWAALAGERLDEVVAFELYKHLTPERLTRSILDQLLALNNRAAIEKLALLEPGAIEALLTISTNNLNALAAQLSPQELAVVAGYLPLLTPEQKNQLIGQVVSNPQLAALLANDGVKQRIIASSNVDATLAFLSQPRSAESLYGDLTSVLGGQVGLGLFVYKYGAGQSALVGVSLLVLLLVLLRLLYGLFQWLVSPVSGLFRRIN
jgi:hypothetical protein